MAYRNILIPLDGSAFARRALDEMEKVAAKGQSRIVLLGVLEFPTAQFEGYAEFVSGIDIHDRLRVEMEKALAKEADALRAGGHLCQVIVREGFPHEEIAAVCDTEGIDLIVMTTHGRTGLAHWILGSVAERVVRSAPCSVLVVRPTREEMARHFRQGEAT